MSNFEVIKKFLPKVASPARYVGGEFNSSAVKDNAPLQFCLNFPDTYEVGSSNLGIKILYGLLNARDDTFCDTCFAPWPDFCDLLKSQNVPLYALATKKPLKGFDILGFSLASELNYTNALYMLDLAGLKLLSKDRKASDPVVMAGGMATINPAPIAAFFDLLVIGDGEEVLTKLADLFVANKKAKKSKVNFLQSASKLEGVYVPAIHDEILKNDSTKKIKRAIIKDLDKAFYPTKPQIPNVEAVHNRANLELFRGCTRGCRFCQAGFIGRPVRYKKPETLKKQAVSLIDNLGYDEIGLCSLSTSDYPHLKEFLDSFKPIASKRGVKISLPSTRLDSFKSDMSDEARKSSITFAPEAATQKLRNVINKNITETDIDEGLAAAFKKGYSSVKLYFMIGLPTETEEDRLAMISLVKKIRWLYRNNASNKKPLNITVSASTFVPKAFTPFSHERQISFNEIQEAQYVLKQEFKKIGVKFSFHDANTSLLEAVLGRGDSSVAKAIELAFKSGAKFDAWTEKFNFEIWQAAFKKAKVNIEKFTGELDHSTMQPWEIIDCGISKQFLQKEKLAALKEQVSAGCETKCMACGVNKFVGSCLQLQTIVSNEK